MNSYYVHADWRNNGKNQPKTFDGTITFAQPAYGVIKDTAGLINTHGPLGAPGTAYSAGVDQGQEGYGDQIWFSDILLGMILAKTAQDQQRSRGWSIPAQLAT